MNYIYVTNLAKVPYHKEMLQSKFPTDLLA